MCYNIITVKQTTTKPERKIKMKRVFVTAEDYNMVVMADDNGRGFVIDETAFDEPLTLEVARNADYSSFDGCETAEECAESIGTAEAEQNVISFNAAEYSTVVEF